MTKKQIIIPGTPIAKKRPRFFRRGEYIKSYNPQEAEEGRFRFEIKSQWANKEPTKYPMIVRMQFVFQIPKGTSKKNQAMMLSGEIRHSKKPDIDNLAKFYLDAMNGIVFHDDRQVYELDLSKLYGHYAHTGIVIELS